MSISELEPGRYRVEFSTLEQGGGFFNKMKSMLSNRPTTSVDLYRIGLAVCSVMARSSERDVDGSLLAWNEYRVYLSRSDYDRLRALQARLQRGLEDRIRQQLDKMKARTVGDPIVRVLVDEETDLPQGVGEVLVAYVVNEALLQPGDGEMTVRVAQPKPAIAGGDRTQRVIEPGLPGGSGATLRWPQGEARVPPGARAQVGRPHAGAPGGFIALTGASNRINSAQFHIETNEEGVVISRPVRSNPVKVGGRNLQPGGRMVITGPSVDIELSNGEMVVTLEIV